MGNTSEVLLDIGFNRLEAEVYIYLLTHAPLTAYKIGKGINKPTANVYKAIENLSAKGAVMVEDNVNKLCRAINPEELLNHFEKSVIEKTRLAKEILKDLEYEHNDERSYSIESVPLVFERFRSMMGRCKTIAVIDAFPKTLERVIDSIESATKRGVEVFVEVYKPIKVKGANIAYSYVSEKATNYWKSQQLNLVIDGEEHLIALLDNDLSEVKQAVWSSNTYMSCILHAGLLREQTVMQIMSEMDKPNFEKNVKKIIDKQKFFFNTQVSGFNKLHK